MGPVTCRRWYGKNRRGLELIRLEFMWGGLFPGAGCSGLNKPDSGAGAGGFGLLLWVMVVRVLETSGCGPLAATLIGRGRKCYSAAICRRDADTGLWGCGHGA